MSQETDIKIMVVEDQEMVRTGFVELLNKIPGFRVIADASTGEEAVKLAAETQPDVILMDLDLPGIDGIKATKKILAKHRNIKIIALTGYLVDPFPANFLQAGGKGYVTKNASFDKITDAIHTVVEDNIYLMPNVAERLAIYSLAGAKKPRINLLSNREREVMVMLTKGVSVKEIAEQLCVTEKTVNTYRYRIYEKLNIDNDVQIALSGIRYGLVQENLINDPREDLVIEDKPRSKAAKEAKTKLLAAEETLETEET